MLPRYAARTDANQQEIIDALEAVGCSVQPLTKVGGGVPDLLVGYRGRNFLMEIKDGSKAPSERKLNALQVKWHERWRGQKVVIETKEQALAFVLGYPY